MTYSKVDLENAAGTVRSRHARHSTRATTRRRLLGGDEYPDAMDLILCGEGRRRARARKSGEAERGEITIIARANIPTLDNASALPLLLTATKETQETISRGLHLLSLSPPSFSLRFTSYSFLVYRISISNIRYPCNLLPVADDGIGYRYRNPIPTPRNQHPTHGCRYRVLYVSGTV